MVVTRAGVLAASGEKSGSGFLDVRGAAVGSAFRKGLRGWPITLLLVASLVLGLVLVPSSDLYRFVPAAMVAPGPCAAASDAPPATAGTTAAPAVSEGPAPPAMTPHPMGNGTATIPELDVAVQVPDSRPPPAPVTTPAPVAAKEAASELPEAPASDGLGEVEQPPVAADLPWEDPKCSEALGWDFLYTWRRQPRVPLCAPPDSPTKAWGKVMTGTWVDFPDRADAVVEFQNARVTRQDVSQQPNVGTVIGLQCQRDRSHSVPLPSFAHLAFGAGCASGDLAVQGPVMLVYRFDHPNVYHIIESLVATLMSAMVADVDPRNTLLVFLDAERGKPDRPHAVDALHRDSFAPLPKDVEEAWAQKRGLCLQHGIVSLTSRGGLMPSSWSGRTPCDAPRKAEMLRHFVRYAVTRFNVQWARPPQRAWSVLTVERRDPRDGSRHLERKLDPESVRRLCDALESSPASSRPVRTRRVDLATMTMHEQLLALRRSHILLGVHGAALTYVMFQRPDISGLVELYPPGYGAKAQRGVGNIFINLAKWMSRPYRGVHVHLPYFQVEPVVEAVRDVIKEIAHEEKPGPR